MRIVKVGPMQREVDLDFWEDVWGIQGDFLQRTKVSGGWLYRQVYRATDNQQSIMAMVFVPGDGSES